jgi:group 1 family glycosyltransferase
MRIGLFTDAYVPSVNGVVTSVETLKKALEKKGHVVYIVTVGQDSRTYDYDEKEKVLKIPGIPLGIYDYRMSSFYPIKVINKIKSWDLEIIHSHTELSMGIFARLFAKQYNIPLVHTYHTMYKDYTWYVSRNIKYFDLGCKKAVEYFSKFYCDNTADAFIVPTVKTYHLFRDEYHYDKDIYIVPTGLDASRFYKENSDKLKVLKLRHNLGYKRKDFVMLFVGRLAQEKNVPFLFDIIEKTKNKNVKLLIVGYGPDEDKYKKEVKERCLEDRIKFTGKVAWIDMPNYYHVSNAFITASTTETQGLTVIEALAASLPVICIDDDAFKSVVVDNFNGRIFKDEKECSEIVEELSTNKLELENLTDKAEGSVKKYSLSSFAESVLEVYKVAITKHNKKQTLSTRFVEKLKNKWKDGKKNDSSLKSQE